MDPLHPTPDQGEQHHEKKSVLKKVKAKAKKIKDSIGGNKTHGGHTDHDHDHDEEEDEYEENDELVQDSGVHGAPMHESAAAKNFAASQDASPGQSRLNMDAKPHFDENPDQNVCPGTFQAKVTDPDIPSKDSLGVLGEHHGVGDDPNATKHRHQDVNETGGHEAGVTPIVQSFNKMGIYDEPKQKKDSATPGSHDHTDEPRHKKDSTPSSSTGSNDQFSPSSDLFTSKPSTIPENAQSVPESYNAGTENHPQDMNVDEPPKQQSGYTDKISSVSFAIANRAMSAKNVLASKIGYGGTDDSKGGENVPSAGMPTASTDPAATATGERTTQQSSYTDKISFATSAITGKAVSAKNAVASKLGYGGSESAAGVGTGSVVNRADDGKTVGTGSDIPGTGTQKTTGTGSDTDVNVVDKGSETGAGSSGVGGNSMKGYLAEKLKPGEEDRALSEVISGALHRRNNEDDVQKKPMGKVTESEEVARRLGSTEEEKSGKVVVDEKPGTGVVNKFTGAFTNWFGKGGETNPSQMFNDQAPPSNQGSTREEQGMSTTERGGAENVSHGGERKPQESTS